MEDFIFSLSLDGKEHTLLVHLPLEKDVFYASSLRGNVFLLWYRWEGTQIYGGEILPGLKTTPILATNLSHSINWVLSFGSTIALFIL